MKPVDTWVLGVVLAACASSPPAGDRTDANIAVDSSLTLDAQTFVDADQVRDASAHDARLVGDADVDASDAPPVARGVLPARTTQAFVDSVGVNTHITYTDRNYWDFPQLASTIAELGIRHIRDGQPAVADHLNPQSTAGIVTTRMQALAATGVKATLISGYALDSTQANNYARDQLMVFKHLGSGIAAFEHTNEPDLFAARDDDQWEAHLRAYLPVLWQERNADVATAMIPVLAPSVTFEFQAFAESFPTQRDVITHCNVHPYPGGQPPESNVLRAIGSCRAFIGDVPAVATETGYHTAINDTSGHNGVSAIAQGIYMPRLFLEYFAQGFVRTHSYELLDEYADPLNNQREAQFGLVRLDWSRKPAFIALRRLLMLLADDGPELEASGTELSVSDRNARTVLLEKRDGSFWIALWRPVSVFDLATKTDIAVTPTPVTLTFGATPSSVVQHALVENDPQTVITPTGATLSLDLGAEVVLLEVRGLPRHTPHTPVIDHFDDLSVASAASGVAIENNPVRMFDFDRGLGTALIDGAQLTYDVNDLHDFALRGYFFCAGCLNDPLQAVVFQTSADGTNYTTVPHSVVDRRPTMDAREVVTLVPQQPLPEGTHHLRILLGRAAPKLAELVLRR